MWITLGELRDSTVGEIAGVAPDSPAFSTKVNEAVRRLLRRGNFPGTVAPLYVCVHNGCIVMPRYVDKIRKVNVCRHEMDVKGLWWRFLDVNRSCGWAGQSWWGWLGANVGWQDNGRSPVFSDILGDGRTVRAYKSTPLDNNKTITVFGTDTNGDTLMTKGSGTWTEGYQLVLPPNADFVETPMQVRNITRILKDETQGFVELYAFNLSTQLLENLGHYEPSETNPNYAKYRVQFPVGNMACCSASKGVVILAKLAYVPAKFDNDLILIDNIDALKAEVQSARFGEAGDIQSKAAFEADAVHELNRQSEDETPDQQVPVSNETFAGTRIGRQHCY